MLFAVSWSGGKDCCLAFWKAESEGFEVQCLLNTYREDSGRVAFHGVRTELIRRQAKALGKTLVQKKVGRHNYEEVFLGALTELKSRGFEGVVFGDIDVMKNREWCESVARRAGLEPVFPLWNMDQKKIIEEFIGAGFKAVVVAIDSKHLEKNDLGKRIDHAWLKQIEGLRMKAEGVPITYCGENGEYHSFVYGGPPFKSDITIKFGATVEKDGHCLLDVLGPSSPDEADFSTTSNI